MAASSSIALPEMALLATLCIYVMASIDGPPNRIGHRPTGESGGANDAAHNDSRGNNPGRERVLVPDLRRVRLDGL